MKNLFTLNKDLWDSLTSSNPTLLTEATMQKINAITCYLEGELQTECGLSPKLTDDIRMLFVKRVWHYSDAEDFELPIDVMLGLLVDSLECECQRQGCHSEAIEALSRSVRELVGYIPESFKVHESRIRAMVIHSYMVERYTQMGCSFDAACELAPSLHDIEHRLMMDAFS